MDRFCTLTISMANEGIRNRSMAVRKICSVFSCAGFRRRPKRKRPADRRNPCPPRSGSNAGPKRGVKKLRESAAKALKLLVRVNLCAGLPERPGLPEGSAGLTKVERRPSLWDLLPPSPEANQARLRSKFDDPFKGEGLQAVLRSGFPRVCDSRAFAGGPNEHSC
jgi:hypothetical protein